MIYTQTTTKNVQQVIDDISNIISDYKFGILHIHNVKETLNSKGIAFEKECRILDICNPAYANKFLSADMSLSVVMPCKITVYEDENETKISMNSLVQLIDDINPDFYDDAVEAQNILLELIEKVK